MDVSKGDMVVTAKYQNIIQGEIKGEEGGESDPVCFYPLQFV